MCTLSHDLVLGGHSLVSAEPRISQSGCSGVVINLYDEGQQFIVISMVHQSISGLCFISHRWLRMIVVLPI